MAKVDCSRIDIFIEEWERKRQHYNSYDREPGAKDLTLEKAQKYLKDLQSWSDEHPIMQDRKVRLIDADALKKVMTEDWFLDILAAKDNKRTIAENIVNIIDSVPLAYDADKVVEQLEKSRYTTEDKRHYIADVQRKMDSINMGLNIAIDIVGRGGIDG